MNNIDERVKRIIAESACRTPAEIELTATFESLGLDSLDTTELLMALEDEFCLEIMGHQWDPVKTTQQAIDLVHRLGVEQGVI